MNQSAWEDRDAYDGLMTLIPYKRIGEPEEILSKVVYRK